MFQNDVCKVLTGKVRLSYCNLITPRAAQQGGEVKYSVTLLIPKSDLATKAEIDAAIQGAAKEGMEKTWKGARPPQLRVPIYDGDGVRPSGEPFGEECRGHWVMTASSKQKPGVIDTTLSPIMEASDIYSGMYARVTVRFFAYSNSGNKGIGCGLNNVMKVADGEPLGGHASAQSDFSGIAQEYTAVPASPTSYGAPGGYAVPGYPAYPPVQPMAAPAIDPITGMPMQTMPF